MPCYFLLNYAWLYAILVHELAHISKLAIFFWIMLSELRGYLCFKPEAILLFSFELCWGGNEKANGRKQSTYQLAIFFWIMPRIYWQMFSTYNRGDSLLFSFELCFGCFGCCVDCELFPFTLLFSFELCWQLLEEMLSFWGGGGLAIFFWIMLAPHRRLANTEKLGNPLAIFFWIMRLNMATGGRNI